MRLYQTGFELDDDFVEDGVDLLLANRWSTGSFGANGWSFENSGTEPWVHTTPAGLGGSNAIYRGPSLLSATIFSNRFPHNFREAWIGFAFKIPTEGNSRLAFSNSLEGTSLDSPQIEILARPDGGATLWLGGSSSGTQISSELFLLTPGYHWFAIKYLLNNSGGIFQVYADNTLWLNFTGDTRGNDTYNYWDQFAVSFANGSALDDFVINGVTISYTGGSGGGGTPATGNTVTGGASGSTAIITDFKETTAGVGYLLLEQASGDFNPSESISDGSGWSATTALVGGSPGFDKNSGQPDETYIVVTRPNGTVSAGLTGSDGNQIDNHLQVSDTFTDESTYNFASAPGVEDVYSMQSLPFSPATIDAVEPVMYANRAGSVVGARTILDPGLGNTYSETLQVGSGGTSAKAGKIYDVNPDTDTDWTESDVNGTDVGVRFV